MKKILTILMLFLLCACNEKELIDDNIENNNFIEPVSEIEVFEYLNDDTYNLLYKANDYEILDTISLKNLGKDLVDYTLYDYYGNVVNLNDYKDTKLVIELVTSNCSYCKNEAMTYIDDLKEGLGDITLIQYFMIGDSDGINSFYKEIEKDIPSNIIVIPCVKDFSSLIQKTYDLKATPTFLFFTNGKLSWYRVGLTSTNELNMFYDIAFENALDLNALVDKEGKSIFSYLRTSEDVKNELSDKNYQKLLDLDNDEYTISMTLDNIGKTFDFYDQLDDESSFTSEVNFLDYLDSDLMIVFVEDLSGEQVLMLNSFYQNNKDIEIIVLDTSDEDTKEKADKLDAKVVSIMNQIPSFLNEIDFVAYPSCLYIKEGIITGVYSNIESLEKLEESVDIFLKDTCIALTKNN